MRIKTHAEKNYSYYLLNKKSAYVFHAHPLYIILKKSNMSGAKIKKFGNMPYIIEKKHQICSYFFHISSKKSTRKRIYPQTTRRKGACQDTNNGR